MTRRCGPETRRRLTSRELPLAEECWKLHWIGGLSYRQVASVTGLSLTTAWRRACWWGDWILPTFWGRKPPRQLPPQRGTERCPKGRPYISGHDDKASNLPEPVHM